MNRKHFRIPVELIDVSRKNGSLTILGYSTGLVPLGDQQTVIGPPPREPRSFLEMYLVADGTDWHIERLDNAYIVNDSPVGEAVIAEAESLKIRGNKSLKENDLETAYGFYCEALNKALDVVGNYTQLSILYSNMSYVSTQIGRYNEARMLSLYCINLRPDWYKGPLRLIEAYLGYDEYENAFLVCGNVMFREIPSNKERGKIFRYYIKCASHVKDGYKVLRKTWASDSMWGVTLANLCSAGDWKILCVLFGVGDGTKEDPDIRSHGPIVTSDLAGDVELYRVLEECGSGDKWKEWGEKLVVVLIDKGADWRSVARGGAKAVHVVIKQTIESGSDRLLKKIIPKISETEINEVDNNGESVFDIAISKDYSCRSRVVDMLRAAGANQKETSVQDVSSPTKPERFSEVDADNTASRVMASWTNDDVMQWFVQHNLQVDKERLKEFRGLHLVELRMIQDQAPQFFMRSVQKHLGLNLTETLTFSQMLREIR